MNLRRGRRAVALALAASTLAMAGCLPRAVTDRGREVADLYTLFMIAAAGVFLLVVGLLSWTIVRYRGNPGRDVELPRQTHGNVRLEVIWWAIPTALVGVLIVLTVGVLSRVDAREEAPSVTVEVAGFQWGWQFTYADADVTVTGTAADPPTLRLPVDRTIAFVITSEDVVHSFNIPNFLIKRDAVPNMETRFDLVIEDEATYGGQCGEFCGLLHARQLFESDAIQPEAFDSWLAEQAAAP